MFAKILGYLDVVFCNDFLLHYVNRKANIVAHSFSKIGLQMITQQTWTVEAPHQLYSLVIYDFQ